LAAVALFIKGVGEADVNPPGPFHMKDALVVVPGHPKSCSFLPVHIGLLLLMLGESGSGFTVKF
jgi:hypothetical protein